MTPAFRRGTRLLADCATVVEVATRSSTWRRWCRSSAARVPLMVRRGKQGRWVDVLIYLAAALAVLFLARVLDNGAHRPGCAHPVRVRRLASQR